MLDAVFSLPVLLYELLVVQAVILMGVVVLDNRGSAKTYAWLLAIAFLPLLGLVLYLFFGRNWRAGNKRRKLRNAALYETASELLREVYDAERRNVERASADPTLPGFAALAKLAYAAPFMFPVSARDVKLYSRGDAKFEDLVADIRAAQRYVHLEYYIIASDAITAQIVDALCERAEAGVEVRVYYDWVGSFGWRRRDKKRLRKAGAVVSSGTAPLDTINYRSHRKLVVVDGSVAYIGGMNLGESYATGGTQFPAWRDAHLRITGNFAVSVEALFAHYWVKATGEQLLDEHHVPKLPPPPYEEAKMVQLIHSGADTEWETVRQVFERMIDMARDRVYLETPYFIPQEGIVSALVNASLSGVEVKLVIAGVSDNLLAYNAACTFFEELLLAGVEIHLYQPGFLHSKVLSVDGRFCMVGSANLDPRSMEINYEANAIVYDPPFTAQLDAEIREDMAQSRRVTLEEIESASLPRRLMWSVARLLAPLL